MSTADLKPEHKNNSHVANAPRKRSVVAEFRKKIDKKTKQSKGWAFALKLVWVVMMGVWIWAVLMAVQLLMSLLLIYVFRLNDATWLSSNALQTLYSAIVYVVALLLIIFIPWRVAKSKTTRDELGLRGLPTWTDILLAPVGFIVFMILAVALTAVMQAVLPNIDWNEAQDVGYTALLTQSDFILAFLSLVVIAPIAEEIIFRGWLYGKLRAKIPAFPAMIAVSILFGLVHGQWNVGVTVFVMSLAMCTIREITGTIWGGVLVHIIKNALAFYLLYVNPVMIQ